MLFFGKADLGGLVLERKRPAGVQIKRQRQHQHREGVVRGHHDGVGVKAVGRSGVQLGGKPRGCPVKETAAQIPERIAHGQRRGGRGGPHPEKDHAHAPQRKYTGALGPLHAGGGLLFGLAEAAVQQFLTQTVAGLQQTPHHKGQRIAVPEARHKKHREYADLGGQAGQPAVRHARNIGPRQRHKEIVLQPGRKADVPAAPEAGKVCGKKRRFEVLRQGQAEQQPHRAGNLRIAGEVEIQLECVKHSGQHQHGAAVAAVVGEHLVHQQAQHIADGHQLKKAQRQQPQRLHGAGGVKAMLGFELGQQCPGTADRPLRHSGKKVQKQRKVDEACLDLAVAARGVNQVGDGRKGVKADAQRHGHGLPAAVRCKRAVVFEEGKDRQQPANAEAQRCRFMHAAPRRQPAAAQVGEHRNSDGHGQHGRHGQRVEHPAGPQQKNALQPLRQVQIHHGHHQQKAEEPETLQAHGRTSQHTISNNSLYMI